MLWRYLFGPATLPVVPTAPNLPRGRTVLAVGCWIFGSLCAKNETSVDIRDWRPGATGPIDKPIEARDDATPDFGRHPFVLWMPEHCRAVSASGARAGR